MDSMFTLAGRKALVTGAAGGLGAHFARTLARAGADVVLAGRRLNPLKKIQQELQSEGRTAFAVSMDVSDPDSVSAALDDASEALGVIDIAICNAGAAVTKPAIEISVEEWDSILNVNLKGCWLVATEVAKRLVRAGQPGSIVNVSSILGYRVAGLVLPYTVSKAGVEQLTRALALEWARHGIRVNALAPATWKPT